MPRQMTAIANRALVHCRADVAAFNRNRTFSYRSARASSLFLRPVAREALPECLARVHRLSALPKEQAAASPFFECV